jgi:transcriptional regulator with XRE-family HTH domain
MDRIEFGKLIQKERKKRGMTLRKLSQSVTLKSGSLLSKIEAGLKPCSVRLAIELSDCLGMEAEWILEALASCEAEMIRKTYKMAIL